MSFFKNKSLVFINPTLTRSTITITIKKVIVGIIKFIFSQQKKNSFLSNKILIFDKNENS